MVKPILDVRLNEVDHVYTDSLGKRYDSATTIIGHYKEKFDPYKIMKDGGTLIGNYVKKYGHTEQYWLEEWEGTKNRACAKGTAFHKIKEMINNNSPEVTRNSSLYVPRDFEAIVQSNPGIDYSKLPPGLYAELTMFNRRYMISGQADEVFIDDDLFFDIDDFKTNGKFDTVSFKPPRGNHKMMTYPLHRFMDCHLSHYTIQLSLYAWMLEQFGLKPRELKIKHYTIREEDEAAVLAGEPVEHIEPEIYIVPYEKAAVEAMIKHYTQVVRPTLNRK